MLKLLFWGVIGYIVYRYFQMKQQIKDERHVGGSQQRQHFQQHAPPEKMNDGGEYIDYEEIKKGQ